MKKLVSFFTLFLSTSTLICCALPALFVALGAGAVVAGLVEKVPGLVFLSDHKVALFIFAGLMLSISGVMQFRAKKLECPTDPALRDACATSKNWSRPVWFLSAGLYLIGVFFAFIAPWLFYS